MKILPQTESMPIARRDAYRRRHLARGASLLLLTLLWLWAIGPAAGYGQQDDFATGEAFRGSPEKTGQALLALKVYRMDNGRMQSRVFGSDLLRDEWRLSIPGYVSGLVAVGRPGLIIRVGEKTMSPARLDVNGELSLGYYGTVNPAQLVAPPAGAIFRQSMGDADSSKRPWPFDKRVLQVYSLFPSVAADTISAESDFALKVSSADELIGKLHVSHYGIFRPAVPGTPDVCDFRYIGMPGESLCRIIPDFEERQRMIAGGIAAVESAFGTNLVDTVRIIACNDIQNAVTCENRSDIWLYINTLSDEPLNELRIIAEHEALHILVDKVNITADTGIRKIYADLKGFGDLSIERFQVVARGHTPSTAKLKKGKEGYFFDFISERNFFKGMKGGHPEENLDEFCTSFIHTLLYPDMIQINLTDPLRLIGAEMPFSENHVRAGIIDRYIGMLKMIHAAIEAERTLETDNCQPSFNQFFLKHRDTFENLNRTFAANHPQTQDLLN